VLCRAVSESPAEGRPIFDTHLFHSSELVVIPAVGPICVGHVMVVSKQHLSNLASFSESQSEEYEALIASISKLPGYSRENLLEAEHGSSSSESGGSCINHLHVNLIPGFGAFGSLFDDQLPKISTANDLKQVKPSTAPYIFLRGAGMQRVYDARGVPSQLIRRALFDKLGRTDWDWAVFPHLDIVKKTLQLWENITNV
jgi:diadenosine tetraphosphate (Ap4A) HIT family hydrolase